MFAVLFLFWLLLNGQWTTEIAVVGLVLDTMICLFLWKFLDWTPGYDWKLCKRVPAFFVYAVRLVRWVFEAAWATLKLVWSPVLEPEPVLTGFRTHLKTRLGKVMLANSITMTPGTITVDVQDDMYIVHCLDSSFSEGLENSFMEYHIGRLEEGGPL